MPSGRKARHQPAVDRRAAIARGALGIGCLGIGQCVGLVLVCVGNHGVLLGFWQFGGVDAFSGDFSSVFSETAPSSAPRRVTVAEIALFYHHLRRLTCPCSRHSDCRW